MMMTIKGFCTLVISFCIIQFCFAQTHTIKGKIKDRAGMPVPFVSVQVKGQKTVVVADSLGLFALTASVNSAMVFNGVGFEEKRKEFYCFFARIT